MKSIKLNSQLNEKTAIKDILKSKQFIMFCIMSVFMITPIFAQSGNDTIQALDTWSDKILGVLGSTWLKVLILIVLIAEAIGVIVGGQQQGGGGQIFKKFAPWIIGTIILLCASGIVTFFYGTGTIDFKVN